MSVDDWRRETFLVNPPCKRTVIRWAESGQIPAQKLGGKWFVKVDGSGAASHTEVQRGTGHAGADALLAEWIGGVQKASHAKA